MFPADRTGRSGRTPPHGDPLLEAIDRELAVFYGCAGCRGLLPARRAIAVSVPLAGADWIIYVHRDCADRAIRAAGFDPADFIDAPAMMGAAGPGLKGPAPTLSDGYPGGFASDSLVESYLTADERGGPWR